MRTISISCIQAISGSGHLDRLDLEWHGNDPHAHGQLGGGYGQDIHGNHYGEFHGSLNVGPNVELNANMTITNQGKSYYFGGDVKF